MVLTTKCLELSILIPQGLKLNRIQRFGGSHNTMLMWHHPLPRRPHKLLHLFLLALSIYRIRIGGKRLIHALADRTVGAVGTHKDRSLILGSVIAVACHVARLLTPEIVRSGESGFLCADDAFAEEDFVGRDASPKDVNED
jgi:hypothetical protein